MTPIGFRPQTSQRLKNQIERALRHTYGAITGLRILVGLSTRELLGAGASRDEIHRALADCVRTHDAPPADEGEGQRAKLVDSMLEWADQVCATTPTHTQSAAAT